MSIVDFDFRLIRREIEELSRIGGDWQPTAHSFYHWNKALQTLLLQKLALRESKGREISAQNGVDNTFGQDAADVSAIWHHIGKCLRDAIELQH